MSRVLLMSASALALSFSTQSQAASQESASESLDVITVTAQRREQSAQDVPVSLSVFNGAALESRHIETITDLDDYTPNFTVATSQQQTNARISIRGIGSVGNTAIEPSVGVFVDGVYYPRPGAIIGALMDIEQVEVLRGPQGTLFGRNTPAGALNITTRDPSENFESFASASYGDFNAVEAEGVVSGPISDSINARLALRFSERDGYGDNRFDGGDVGEQENITVRGKMRFEPSDALEFQLTADYARLETGGPVVEVLNRTSTPIFEATVSGLYGDTPVTGDSFDYTLNQSHRDSLQDEQWGVTLEGQYVFGDGHRLRSITAFRDWRADIEETALRLPADVFPRNNAYATETVSQEIQLLSPENQNLEYILGLFYYNEDYTIGTKFGAGADFCNPTISGLVFQQALAAGATPSQAQAQAASETARCLAAPQSGIIDAPFSQEVESLAAFGQASWRPTSDLRLTLGGRWTDDEKTGAFEQRINNPFAGLFRAPEVSQGLEAGDTQFTYFANASYFLRPEVMVFATASTGFKSGGFNSQGTARDLGATGGRVFGPEDSRNYELGVKSRLFADDLTLNLTLFRTEIDDLQERSFDGFGFVTDNAGELIQQGVEIDYSWRPDPRFTIGGGASILDSEFESFPAATPLPGRSAPQDLAGTERHFSPDWQASTVARWEDQLGFAQGVRWFARGEWTYTGEQNVGASSNNNPQSVQEGYSLFNAGLGLSADTQTWSVEIFGRNLSDEGYCSVIFDQTVGDVLGAVDPANGVGVQRCVLGAPRTFGVQVRGAF